jgi:hypothetical protein
MFPSNDPRVCREDFLSLFETDFVLSRSCHRDQAMATPYRERSNVADRLSRNPGIMQSVRDDRDRLSFGNDIVELDEKRCDRAARGRGHGYLHLHRFDDYNFIAIRNGSSNLHGRCADASRNFSDDLYFWHAIAFLLSSQNA